MPVKVLIGDLFQSQCQTWVNTVNCVGVMGKGVALEFKKRFPDMYQDYTARCERHEVSLGRPYLYKSLLVPWILNFPTKDHWRSLSKLSDISEGLEYLKQHYKEWGIESLAVPPLGAGQGQLDWSLVGPVLYRQLGELDIPVELYAPHGTAAQELSASFLTLRGTPNHSRSPVVAPGLIAVVEILHRIETEQFRWPVGRTMFQKVAYFATVEGLDTGLSFSRSSFGPFSPDLKLGVTRLINNGLVQERQRGQMFEVFVGPTYGEVRNEVERQIVQYEPQIERIADLFLRMNSKQAEIAATVHYAAVELGTRFKRRPSEWQVFHEVLNWKRKRKPPLDPKDIGAAIRNLAVLGWIDVDASSELKT